MDDPWAVEPTEQAGQRLRLNVVGRKRTIVLRRIKVIEKKSVEDNMRDTEKNQCLKEKQNNIIRWENQSMKYGFAI